MCTETEKTQGKKKTLTLKLDKELPVDYCMIQEDITQGERIRQYKVEAKVNGKWLPICTGESVGHKRIESFDPVTTQEVRLTVLQSVAQPEITNFSIYATNR